MTLFLKIKHFNKIKLYQIPIAIGKTWGSEKWQTGLLMGGTFNIYSENKGRTLYQGQVLDYDDTVTEFMTNQWGIQATLVGRLTYKISDHLGLTSGIQIQKSLNNWSKEQNTTMRPTIFNLELGLSYSLK